MVRFNRIETNPIEFRLILFEDVSGWSHDDERQLVANVKSILPKIDKFKIGVQINKLDWSKVEFGNYSADECQSHFQTLVKSVRTFRVLSEIMDDVESNLSKNPYKRPPSSYNLYIKDMCRIGKNKLVSGSEDGV